MELMNGNQAAAYVSCLFSELAAIYPITPSSKMAEYAEDWQAEGKKNLFNQTVEVVNANSEVATIAMIHGALKLGTLSTTYTSSQGLLLMLPTMAKIAGELLPTVIHVASRSITTNGQSIAGDHSDVMAARFTGFAMLAASTVQEVMDFAAIAHLATVASSVPFLHFFDGFQTSHQLTVVEKLEKEQLQPLIDKEALENFKQRALNTNQPKITGMNHDTSTHFECREMLNPFYDHVEMVVKYYMQKVNAIRTTHYELVNYYGASDAKYVIVAMGAVCQTIENTIDILGADKEKIGYLNIRLYRPFPVRDFLTKLSKTVEKIAVLDRTKEAGSSGEPLLLDVSRVLNSLKECPHLIGGRYGLGGKNVTPTQIKSVFDHLQLPNNEMKTSFTIGIHDDITNLSLKQLPLPKIKQKKQVTAHFFGIASDKTITQVKQLALTLYEKNFYVQLLTTFTAHKYGGLTMAQLRYSQTPIKANHIEEVADFVYYAEYAKQLKEQQGDFSVSMLMKEGLIDGTVPRKDKGYQPVVTADYLPKWDVSSCTMCHLCAYVCPHATIRPFIADEEEIKGAPISFSSKPLKGKADGHYSIQIAPHDCTGCGLCVAECPKGEVALRMEKADSQLDVAAVNWQFAQSLTTKDKIFSKVSVFGSQLQKPLLEFPSACAGCGETIYVKLLTQLFGNRMVIANATGCSSIWAASSPHTPYTVNQVGQGPAWATSLFENNAEFGLGMQLATRLKRKQLAQEVALALEMIEEKSPVYIALKDWLVNVDESKQTSQRAKLVIDALEEISMRTPLLERIYLQRNDLIKPSHWFIGGDGWAYDIGFNGIDHALRTDHDINILVLDNENYANTGGQLSKAAQAGTYSKFNTHGKKEAKKDLGAYALTLGNVYVAQVTYSMNPNKVLQILTEAESYPGPSLIIAYTPCIYHGIEGGMINSAKNARLAVECGYWANYHYNPLSKQPLTIDYKNPDFDKIPQYLFSQTRFSKIIDSNRKERIKLVTKCQNDAKQRFNFLKQVAQFERKHN